MELKSEKEFPRGITGAPVENEISLVDLFLILVKHKKWIALSLIASLSVGLFYVYRTSKVELYQYTTQIELADLIYKEKKIDSVGNTLAKLENSYIPYVLNDYAERNPGYGYPAVKASVPKGSDLILLQSKGSIASNALHKEAQESITEKLLIDHKAILNVNKKGLMLILRQEKDKLVKLLNPLHDEKLPSIEGDGFEQALVQAKSRVLISLNNKTKNLVRQRNEVTEKTKDMSKISIAMMIDQDIDRIEEHKQQIGLQVNQIEEIVTQISGLKNSRPLTPMISTRLSNKSASLMIVLSIALGLMIGVFAAFLAEFFSNVRKRMENNSSKVEPESPVTHRPHVVAQKVVDNT